MKSEELFSKARTAAASARILLSAGDYDGACKRAYYAMFDAARAAFIASGHLESMVNTKIIVVSFRTSVLNLLKLVKSQ